MVEGPIREYRKVKSAPLGSTTLKATTPQHSRNASSQSLQTLSKDMSSMQLPSQSSRHGSRHGSRSASPAPTSFSTDDPAIKQKKQDSAGLAAGKEFGKSIGRVSSALTKTLMDVPLALADGLHNVPTLYGEEVRDHGAVKGIKSGGIKGIKVSFHLLSNSCYSQCILLN